MEDGLSGTEDSLEVKLPSPWLPETLVKSLPLEGLYRVPDFELVRKLSVQQLLAYGILYLYTDIKRAATLLTFLKKLKTFLFSKHLC